MKLNPERLEQVRNTIREDSYNLNNEIDNLNSYIKELELVWKGIDSKNFCLNFNNYLEKLKTVPACLNDIEHFISKANKKYCEQDMKFASSIRRDKKNYE